MPTFKPWRRSTSAKSILGRRRPTLLQLNVDFGDVQPLHDFNVAPARRSPRGRASLPGRVVAGLPVTVHAPFASVIIRKSACRDSSLNALAEALAPPNWQEDDRLVSVSFMSTEEAHDFLERAAKVIWNRPADSSEAVLVQLTTDQVLPAWLALHPVGLSEVGVEVSPPPPTLGTASLVAFDSRRAVPELLAVLAEVADICARASSEWELSRGAARVRVQLLNEGASVTMAQLWTEMARRPFRSEDLALLDDMLQVLTGLGGQLFR